MRQALFGWVAVLLMVIRAHAQPSETVTFSPASTVFTGSVSVALSGAASGQEIRYVVAAGPNAAHAEVTSASPVYTGPIAITTTSFIRAAVFNSSGGGRATSGHYLKAGPSLEGFASNLPVLVLDVLGAGGLEKDDINHQSWLFGFSPGNGDTFARSPSLGSALVASVRGSSSAEFPKKGYNIRMRDPAFRARAAAIFDLPAYERWALVAPWAFDHTYINNSFVYELSNRIGRWAPRTKLVELFYNAAGDELDTNDYGGIYIVTDRIRIEPGRVAMDRLTSSDNTEPNLTGGYVLKIDPPDPDEIGWLTNRGVPVEGPSQIVLDDPGAGDVTPAQLEYIKGYIQRMEDALHADRATNFDQRTYLDYIDRSSWVDHHILNVLVNNPDALHRSAYFTKPRNGRLQAGPVWDFDRAVGGFWDERTEEVNTWSGVNGAVDVWETGWWGILARDPDFIQEWVDRWQTLRRAEFSTGELLQLAQGFANQVSPIAAERDAARWPDNASPYGSYAQQIDHLRSWLTERTAWIDSQFVAAPEVSGGGTAITFTPPEGALLVYTTDGSDPRMAGGRVSPNAHIHAGSLTVPAGTTLKVRSYDPTPRDQFPSSPWSTIVEPFQVSAVTGAGRIVNLSTKAQLGAGEDLIIGFVVAETDAKRYLLRAVGPGLQAFGETRTLNTPEFVVTTSANALITRGGPWMSGTSAAQLPAVSQSVGAFPLVVGSNDAAVVTEVSRGNYTMQVRSTAGEGGTVLSEIYEADTRGRTANVSIRGRASATDPLTGGFVISGGAARVLIRAVGPSLRNFGVADAMADATLMLRAGSAIILSNDSWSGGANGPLIEDTSVSVGAFPLLAGSQDAAVVATLPAGNYTVEVRSKGEGGAVLLEVYDLP